MFGRRVQKLSGASLLVYANKQDIKGALSHDDIAQVLGLHDINQRYAHAHKSALVAFALSLGVVWPRQTLAHSELLCGDRRRARRGSGVARE